MLLYKEDYSLLFKYYNLYEDNIQNLSSKDNCNNNNKKDKISRESYFTIEDIKKSN